MSRYKPSGRKLIPEPVRPYITTHTELEPGAVLWNININTYNQLLQCLLNLSRGTVIKVTIRNDGARTQITERFTQQLDLDARSLHSLGWQIGSNLTIARPRAPSSYLNWWLRQITRIEYVTEVSDDA